MGSVVETKSVRLPKFAVISGFGWLLDVGILYSLVSLGSDVFYANCISAGTAVTFVFFASQRSLFEFNRRSLSKSFLLYVLWQVVMVVLASFAVDALATALPRGVSALGIPRYLGLDTPPATMTLIAKILVTPATMYLNFIFMSWLLEARVSWR